MRKLAVIKYIFITATLLVFAVPSLDAGTSEGRFNGYDKAPLNKRAKQFVKTYIQQNRKNLCSIKLRSGSPFFIIDSVLNHYRLPAQLKYLAVVESELKTRAVSKAGAAGPWQLMPATARIMGLKVNSRYDERKDYYKSTGAAARHLEDLHEEFGDWLLVFAAYNCGDGAVYSAIQQSGTRNFWKLQQFLPRETREYVNKFIATCYYFEGAHSLSLLSRKTAPAYKRAS
jgi:membrane-bound lytic murein transglycosylase D